MTDRKNSTLAALVAVFLLLTGCASAPPHPPAPYEGAPEPINNEVPPLVRLGITP